MARDMIGDGGLAALDLAPRDRTALRVMEIAEA